MDTIYAGHPGYRRPVMDTIYAGHPGYRRPVMDTIYAGHPGHRDLRWIPSMPAIPVSGGQLWRPSMLVAQATADRE